MSCLNFDPPPLPGISGGFSVPPFPIPTFSGNADLCCHFSLFAAPPVNIPLPPGAGAGAIISAINAGFATVDAYLAAVDILSMTCPLD